MGGRGIPTGETGERVELCESGLNSNYSVAPFTYAFASRPPWSSAQ